MASFKDNLRARKTEREARAMPAYKPAAGGDPEIQAMNLEAPLLDAIRADTCEEGTAAGDRIDFHACPICHHRGCFSFYPRTNTWACFSDHNTTGYKGGTFIEYRMAAHGEDVRQAVLSLREATGHPREKLPAKTDNSSSDGLRLPHWENVRVSDPPKRAPALIDGLLRCGHTALFAGKAKSGKSWAAIELAVAVATGGEWLGHRCAQGSVVYCDPELDPRSLDNRFSKVAQAMGAQLGIVDARVLKWSMRGVLLDSGEPPTIEDIAHDIGILKPSGLALVILDSVSCFLGSGDENSSHDVRRLSAFMNRIAEATGAAVLAVHHFGKSLAGDREAIDRARGSSVWSDAPDCPMTITEVFPPNGEAADYLPAGARAFVIDAALREFEPMEPLHIIYEFPLHRVDTGGITADWKPKSSQQSAGRSSGETRAAKAAQRAMRCELALMQAFYLNGIGTEGMEATDAAEVCAEYLGEPIKPATVKAYIGESELFDVWQRSPRRWLVVPRTLPHKAEDPPEQPALSV